MIANVRNVVEAAGIYLRGVPVLGVLITAFRQSQRNDVKDRAAGIAYFGFFSLFPLILGTIAGVSVFLDTQKVRQKIGDVLVDAIPASANIITPNIDRLIELRGPMGMVSILVLLWSGSKMFGAVSRGVNDALGLKKTGVWFMTPIRDFGLTLLVPALVFIPLAISPIVEIVESLNLSIWGEKTQAVLSFVGADMTSFGSAFAVFTALYWLVPYHWFSWKAVVPSALIATLLLQAGKKLFMLSVDNVFRFEAVYGSLSSIVILLLWLYFTAFLILYGAELVSVFATEQKNHT